MVTDFPSPCWLLALLDMGMWSLPPPCLGPRPRGTWEGGPEEGGGAVPVSSSLALLLPGVCRLEHSLLLVHTPGTGTIGRTTLRRGVLPSPAFLGIQNAESAKRPS